MVADLVAKETVRRGPRQHLLVGVARRGVAGDGEVIAVDNRRCVEGLRWKEPSVCMKDLKKIIIIRTIYRNNMISCCVTCVQVCLCVLPELWTRRSSRRHRTHRSRNSRCSRAGDSPAGCRNLVYTDHSELPPHLPEEERTGETSEWSNKT